MAALWWCAFNWKHEPGPKRLKLAVLALLLLVPLLCGLLGILAGVSYSGISVRIASQQLNTTSIPDWITYKSLIRNNWTGGDIFSTFTMTEFLGISKLMDNATSKEQTFLGSGLPTVHMAREDGSPRTSAYLGE